MLYFIFSKCGIFYASVNDGDIEPFNSFEEYKFWENKLGGKRNFSIDKSMSINLKFTINEHKYETNIAHLNFVSWIYYSGLYDYLMNENTIKKAILLEMNEKKLLTNNVFVKCLLYLIANEETETTASTTNNTICNNSDIDNGSGSDNDNGSDNDIDNGSGSDNDIDNNNEVKKFKYMYDIDDIDKYKFLYDLTQSFNTYCYRVYNNFIDIGATIINIF